ncbi:MAG: hypothetical protein ACD_28C00162G0004 [uncultured bacterium]|nr:MAG: hypothetical protein ACD_28C00162G0004 [uncultured bacterium]KKT76997.1 MAG: hypothetical protein UW70_C0006G0003 [Candidatus Peregrinibacteria bacterium GW2011_GWA2_44_7]
MIQNYFTEIQQWVDRKKLTQLEQKRLTKDIEAVVSRMKKKEYQKGGFTTNVFDVPDRTREFYIYLEFYCHLGKTWASLLREIDMSHCKEVVDLCPGYAPKIELGLFYAGYTGKVILLDEDTHAMTELIKFLDLFKPEFQLQKKKINLFGRLRKSYPLVLGNHIIDDLVIYFFAQKFGLTLTELYEKEGTFSNLWQKILSQPKAHLDEIFPGVLNIFHTIVAERGWLILSHYKSYMERLLDLNAATQFNRRLFKKLIKALCQQGFILHKEIPLRASQKYKGHFGPNQCAVLQRLTPNRNV